MQISNTMKFYNGIEIPSIGYGTWKTPDGDTARTAVAAAIAAGYRHIDAAAVYGNEKSVGQGIKDSGIDRSKLFITGKVWNTERGYEKTLAAFEKSCADLQTDYLDLYLIHWPASPSQFANWEEINLSTWEAMTKLYKDGRIKAIGVSNCLPHHMDALVKTEVPPMVNQIEFHPGQMQDEVRAYCKKHQMLVEAYSPLGNGRMLTNEKLTAIASKYDISVAQLCIRWVLQNGVIPLPKSITPSRIAANLDVMSFSITDEDMAAINAMEYCGGSGNHPDKVTF